MQGEGLEKLRIAHVKPLGLQKVEFCEIFARDAGIEATVFQNESLADIWLQYGERSARGLHLVQERNRPSPLSPRTPAHPSAITPGADPAASDFGVIGQRFLRQQT